MWLPFRPKKPKHPISVKLAVDTLPDRLTPSTFFVNTFADIVDDADSKVSLREAITSANSQPGVDTIFLRAGAYNVELPGFDLANAAGDFDISDSVIIRGRGAARTVVDGRQLDRVFDVGGTPTSSISVTFQGLTIQNGYRVISFGGGGILVHNADLTVRDCVIRDNSTSGHGGGISNAYAPGTGNVTLIRTTVSSNVAGSDGGGIYVEGGLLTLNSSYVRGNSANERGGGVFATTANMTNSAISGNAGRIGGGIHAATTNLTNSTVNGNTSMGREYANGGGGIFAITLNLVNSTVSGNTATNGGGIKAETASLKNSTVSNNSATGAGVGANNDIYFPGDGGGILAITANLVNSTVSGNTATNGGGIKAETANLTNCTVSGNSVTYNYFFVSSGAKPGSGGGILATTANLTNSTVSGNCATDRGGGIRTLGGTLLNVTIAENIAGSLGGGVYHDSSPGTLSIKNSIIALNLIRFGGTDPDVYGEFSSQGHNLIGVSSGNNGFTSGDLVGDDPNHIDPKLGPLRFNGGPTQTYALLSGSPAINAGDNSVLVSADPILRDQRGVARRKGTFVDIGAFER